MGRSLIPQHVGHGLSRELAEIIGKRLNDLEQNIYCETIGEVEGQIFNDFARLGSLLVRWLGLSDHDLALDPFKQGEDALEGAAEEHVVADTEKQLEVIEHILGQDNLVHHLCPLLAKSIDGLVED